MSYVLTQILRKGQVHMLGTAPYSGLHTSHTASGAIFRIFLKV